MIYNPYESAMASLNKLLKDWDYTAKEAIKHDTAGGRGYANGVYEVLNDLDKYLDDLKVFYTIRAKEYNEAWGD